MRRVFRTRTFTRWMKRVRLTDRTLLNSVDEMARGLVDAELGGHVVKKRIPLPGAGKRSGARTLVATRFGSRWFFVLGFGKNERGNIDKDELRALQELAADLLRLDDAQLGTAMEAGEILEVRDGDETA
jgi:hypothetical protein